MFVGQRDESFVVNLGQVFDLVNFVPVDGDSAPGPATATACPGGIGIKQDPTNDIISDANITTLALELPAACLTGNGNGVIGGWTSASLRQVRILNPSATFAKPDVNGGALTQVSRLSAAARQRAGDRPAGQGPLQRERAEGRRPVRQVRDQSHAAVPARCAVQQGGERHPEAADPIANLAPSNLPRRIWWRRS